jgi:hypothetical protein
MAVPEVKGAIPFPARTVSLLRGDSYKSWRMHCVARSWITWFGGWQEQARRVVYLSSGKFPVGHRAWVACSCLSRDAICVPQAREPFGRKVQSVLKMSVINLLSGLTLQRAGYYEIQGSENKVR